MSVGHLALPHTVSRAPAAVPRSETDVMSTLVYGASVLASLVLIAAPAAPVVHRFLTEARGEGDVMTKKLFIGGLSFSTSAERLREFLATVEDAAMGLAGPSGQ